MLIYLAFFFLVWRNAPCCLFTATFVPPLFLSIVSLANIVEVALLGGDAAEPEREWRSRYNAWTMILSALWIAVVGTALYGGVYGGGWCKGIIAAGFLHWKDLAGIAAWLATVVSGLLAASGSKTKGDNNRGWREILARVTPFVFLAGLAHGRLLRPRPVRGDCRHHQCGGLCRGALPCRRESELALAGR